VGGILYWFFRSLSISIWSIIGGTLIDLDHLYDYARYPHRLGKRGFDIGHFFEVLTTKKLVNVYVLLHSWELIALVLVSGWFFQAWGDILIPLGFGMAVHILLDAFTNPTSIICYSIVSRYAHRFDGKFFFRK
jgi:hypothetical protein